MVDGILQLRDGNQKALLTNLPGCENIVVVDVKAGITAID